MKTEEKRDGRLALLFAEDDVERWKRTAKHEQFDDLSAWMEHYLDVAAKKKSAPKGAPARSDRKHPVNRRFSKSKLEAWKQAADRCGMTMTSWVERCLNYETVLLK